MSEEEDDNNEGVSEHYDSQFTMGTLAYETRNNDVLTWGSLEANTNTTKTNKEDMSSTTVGGRPKGATIAATISNKSQMQNALSEATDEYMNKMLDSKNNNKRTSKGTISLIIDAAKERNGIPANSATPNKKAIYEQGWYPLNYNVLLHPEIQLTQPRHNRTSMRPQRLPLSLLMS